ncbi:MAG: tRNA (adenosine(37)-N6)-threonylcarbamoyltransferase complex dimerization subunit type 1 TsaB [Saprospiraceae bacterium]|nr:tRNA (adenosine(37)-N6)-threonylcarbamoyltransferase complex dimerization subunit type 1 TsaB [Saprospiraceae bacterium]
MKPIILNIETATKFCSVAVSKGDELISIYEDFNGDHTAVLNTLIRSSLKEADIDIQDLDAISVNEGPGSYTALRVGLVTAKGIAYALDKPLILISGLEALALACHGQYPGREFYLSMLDARRDDVYLSIYNANMEQIIPPQAVILNNELREIVQLHEFKCVIGGNGALKWNTYIQNWHVEIANVESSAKHLIPLSFKKYEHKIFSSVNLAKPFYLKEPNITVAKEKLINH